MVAVGAISDDEPGGTLPARFEAASAVIKVGETPTVGWQHQSIFWKV